MPKRMVLVDPKMATSPRILELAERGQYRAIAVHFFALVRVTDTQSSGFLSRSLLKFVHGRKSDAAVLVDVGLWREFEHGWGLLDWADNLPYRPREPISRAVRAAVFERDGYACRLCGAVEKLSIDHIHPWSLGGMNDIENLQTLCMSCNARKRDRI